MNSPVANGLEQQLDALAAHDAEYARMIGATMIDAVVAWLLSHGGDPAKIAEHLQATADSVMVARRLK